eukprot:gene14759-17438_t
MSKTGSVKWYNETKGYGFITPDNQEEKDIYVHSSAINGDGYKTLLEGMPVSYDIVQSEKGYEAANVTIQ